MATIKHDMTSEELFHKLEKNKECYIRTLRHRARKFIHSWGEQREQELNYYEDAIKQAKQKSLLPELLLKVRGYPRNVHMSMKEKPLTIESLRDPGEKYLRPPQTLFPSGPLPDFIQQALLKEASIRTAMPSTAPPFFAELIKKKSAGAGSDA